MSDQGRIRDDVDDELVFTATASQTRAMQDACGAGLPTPLLQGPSGVQFEEGPADGVGLGLSIQLSKGAELF